MTQAAVSYQVKLLEERLGLLLFVRQPRQVTLTSSGRRLSAAATEAFDTLRNAFAAVRADTTGVLTISAAHAIASNWLGPRLGGFQLAHPTLALRLSTSDQLVDFARDEVDAAIRHGTGPWPGLAMHRLFPVRFTPLCSPELLRRAGPLAKPADLLRLPLLSPTDIWWQRWFDSQQIEGRAAVAGQGVGILTPALWAPELRSGRLVQPFDLVAEDGKSDWLVYPETRRNVAKIRAWRDWLLDEVQRSESEPWR